MKKSHETQKEMNLLVEKEYVECIALFNERDNFGMLSKPIRLNHCRAFIYTVDEYIVLKSYNTIVAAINKDSKIFVDFLRLVYGYTSTSNQHISKFKKLYSQYYNKIFVWRNI